MKLQVDRLSELLVKRKSEHFNSIVLTFVDKTSLAMHKILFKISNAYFLANNINKNNAKKIK